MTGNKSQTRLKRVKGALHSLSRTSHRREEKKHRKNAWLSSPLFAVALFCNLLLFFFVRFSSHLRLFGSSADESWTTKSASITDPCPEEEEEEPPSVKLSGVQSNHSEEPSGLNFTAVIRKFSLSSRSCKISS